MAILSGIPVLNCRNIEASLAFYQLLQFVIVKKREVESSLDWVHLMHGETTLMLQARAVQNDSELSIDSPNKLSNSHTAKSSGRSLYNSDDAQSSISLYFFVDKIEELHHLLRAKNIAVTPLEISHYKMKEFYLTDPGGNKIVIGQAC